MKRTYIIMSAVVVVTALCSCGSDFLDKVPSGEYTAETYYSSDDAVLKGTEPLYNRAWFDFNRRAIVGMGSYRANDAWNPYVSAEFAKFQVTALTEDMALAWSSLYNVVTLSNATLANLEAYCTEDVTESVKQAAIGECYLMRGWAYFYLLRGWGANILFEDNQSMVENPIRPLNPESDVLKFIIRDFRRAAELLPETGTDHHPCKYAAKAALAKALLAQSGWDADSKGDHDRNTETLAEVISLCDEVINSGKYSLMADYEDLFKAQNNDNEETILAMRWADPNSGEWGAMNALYSDLAFSEVTDVNVWGGSLTASVDMLDLYNEDPDEAAHRLHGTFFTPGSYYDYILMADGGYTYNHNWAQNKKGVLGTKADVSPCNLAQMASPLNTYIQRLADVYLIKAEAILGNNESTSDGEALAAFNAVRDRAGVHPYTSITLDDIIRERRIEFCMEYFNWWDMVTWYRWKPQTMLQFFNYKQHRAWETREGDVLLNSDGTLSYRAVFPGNNAWYLFDENGYVLWSDCLRAGENDNTVVQTEAQGYDYATLRDQLLNDKGSDYQPIVLSEANIFMAYPESDVIQNYYFNEDPQPYDFGDDE
ncbi:MAG: RagB/SusD family nutrient uptake outer membrane protein [Prevotella sp.]|nr:RagB/SusD family nutrient uptake outer membrane protein [Prevotella sp.]MCD8305319.1 RagB/SusD family nutrient uptake outer membrane protein [Prevotella sp.]